MNCYIQNIKVRQCVSCVKRKVAPTRAAGLVSMEWKTSMEIVCVDYLKLKQSKGGYKRILVITDHTSCADEQSDSYYYCSGSVGLYGFPVPMFTRRRQNRPHFAAHVRQALLYSRQSTGDVLRLGVPNFLKTWVIYVCDVGLCNGDSKV